MIILEEIQVHAVEAGTVPHDEAPVASVPIPKGAKACGPLSDIGIQRMGSQVPDEPKESSLHHSVLKRAMAPPSTVMPGR